MAVTIDLDDIRLSLRTTDFLTAVRTIKPRRVTKQAQLSECQLGYLDGEAVFCVHGAETRRPAAGRWPGFVCFRFAYLLAFLKVRPVGEEIVFGYADDRLRIDSISVPASWAGTPEWIAEMAIGAHLHGPDDDAAAPGLYCPKCAKLEGVRLSALIQPRTLQEERIILGGRDLTLKPTRECRACGHRWIELNEY